jgi:hypothetical protein
MNFTPEKLKTARDSGYTDDEIWNFLGKDDQRFNLAKENGHSLDDTITYFSKVSPPEPERREGGGVVGGAADIGIQFMKGLGTGTRMISDVFGANNPVSKSIAGYEDYFDNLLSAESKQDSQEISRILKDAEGKGILPQIMAGLEAFTVAPAEMTATTMGIMLPNLAGGVYAKAAQLTKAGVIGLQMGIGAAQGAGSVKGQIYTAVQEELRQQGLPEDKIDDIATEAQAYNGKNLDQILIGAGLGAAASSTGAEKIMTRLITGAGKEASEDIIKSVIKGGFSEAPIEALQGGQEKIAENVALQRIGVDVPTMQGVIPAATMEATAGLLIGGGFGGVEALTSTEQKEEKKIDKQSNQVANELLAENTPATQSVVKELARRENAVANLQEAYDALEPTSQEAQKLKLELSEAQRNLSAFKEVANKAGLSEPITEAERQQAELAKAIVEEPTPTVKESLPVQPAQAAPAPAPVEQVVTPPVEVAPTIAEAAPVEPITPAPVTEQPIEAKPQRYVLQQIVATSGEWRTIQILPNKEAADAEQAKLPEGATGWRIIPETPVTEQAAPEEITIEEATDLGYTQRDPKDVRVFKASKITNESLTNHLEKQGFREGDIIETPTGNAELYVSDSGFAYSWKPKKGRGRDGVIKDPIEGVRIEPVTLRDPNAPAMSAKVSKTQPPKGYVKEGGKYIFKAGVTEQPVGAATPVAEAVQATAPAPSAAPSATPAVSETITELVQRDVTKPEQMTPEEFAQFEEDYDKQAKVQSAKKAKAQIPSESGLAKIAEDNDILRIEGQSEWYSFQVSGKRIKKYTVTENGARGTGFYSAPKGGSNLTLSQLKQWLLDRVSQNAQMGTYTPFDSETAQGDAIYQAFEARRPISSEAYESLESYQKPDLPEGYVKQGELYVYQPAVSETITKPKLGEKGGVLIPTKEDFIQAGQNIYEAGMEFGAWAKQMIQRFGDAVREFLGEVWQAVSGAPAKLNELMGYLPKKGEAGAVNVGKGKIGEKAKAAEKPAEEAKVEEKPAVEPDKEQIKGEKIGPPKKTPEGIIAKTQELLRKQFDPSKVSKNNTTEAFRALGRLTGRGGTDFAKELNDVGRVVDESGAASEISMGAALFINDLFEYSIRLAAEGNKKLLGMMLTNINKLPTAAIGVSDAARDLRARLELTQRFLIMGQAEQDAYTNYVAEFIYGPNPTKDQIQSIKDAYAAVEKTPQVTEQELTDELESVGGRTGTDLVGKINEEFTKATEKGKEKRKTEEAELDEEYSKVQKQADAEIEKLAKIQSDTPSFDPAAARQTANDVRAIVAADLKQRPDMGRKSPWKSMLVAKLQEAGVELTAAETLADIVWRQHEINNLSRELSSINKAIEKGPISEIVKAIKDTPLEEQQKPNWRYEVMRDYLRRAGLNVAQSERIAKLMDISLQKRFTMAQEQAFTDAISKSAPWKSGDTRSRRAFQKVLQALRAGALDPARNVLSDMAALNGWTGFTPEQYKVLLKNDAILSDPEAGELKKAEAYKAIQDVISKAKLPIRARDVIGQYYDAQALSGIPTLTVNSFSPIAFAMRNAIVEIGSGTLKGNPKAITNAATAFVDSIKSWANTVAFSFKNNVTVYSNVDYIVNDDNLLRLYRRGVDQFKGGKTPRERADGVKNMMIGMMDYVRRILNALDYGAIASLQNQNISKYSMAVMKRQKMSTKEANDMFAVMMKAKNDFYLQQIAIGTDKNKASILADEFYISSWNDALTKAGVEKSDIKQAMDAAINDALSSVGRNRQSLDSLKDESTKLKDAGVSSMPALWLLESMASAANQTENQILKLFSRIIYGYAIVPARVIRETAWFSPYGFVRFGYDWLAKKMGKTSPYAQSLGTDVQYSQRLNEAIAGTVALIALASLRAGSTDEPEEDEFKIVFTGNGPKRSDDPQFYDSWYKAGNKPNTMSIYFGKSKFDLNMMRGFEAFTWPAMMLGALDDLEIRKKQKRDTNTASQIEDASIVAGFVFDAALRRGPYAFTTKSLFGTYGDIGVEGIAKGLTFPAKTLIPVLGTSLASNLSNFINDPVDRRTLDGAVWSNIPFIGPAVAPKSLNAFGEPALSTDFASKMFKLGVPIVYDIPTDRESIMLHELVLSKGGGPSIPTRNQLAQRLDRDPTNKEYEMFVKEYGAVLTTSMKKNYEKLSAMKPEAYTKVVERIGNRARDIAENKVRVAAKKP